MKTNKPTAIKQIILGIAVLLVSLTIDSLWSGSAPGFGTAQIAGTVLGVLLMIVGWIFISIE